MREKINDIKIIVKIIDHQMVKYKVPTENNRR